MRRDVLCEATPSAAIARRAYRAACAITIALGPFARRAAAISAVSIALAALAALAARVAAYALVAAAGPVLAACRPLAARLGERHASLRGVGDLRVGGSHGRPNL